MRTEKGTKEKKTKKAGFLTKIVLVVLLVYAGVSLYTIQNQIRSAKDEQEKLAAQVDTLRRENDSLASDIADSGDPEKLRDVARSELGMVMPGERVFYDVSN
ncbi:MAG: cell division protein FtsL [Oscillospiraceae bacterium]|nr:cell division protein FtsL [Oscillospiraceae bacterium]